MADTASEESARRHAPQQKLRKASTMSNPPLVPLIDIFLFLIIYFLLSCQFHQYEGTIPANLPSTLSGGPGEGPSMRVDPLRVVLTTADSSGESVKIEIAETRTKLEDMEALYNFLAHKRAQYGKEEADKLPVIIKPMQGVRWGHVVDAFNQAVRAGMKEVGVAPSRAAAPGDDRG
jgi:biopolymer transport protein ExbD